MTFISRYLRSALTCTALAVLAFSPGVGLAQVPADRVIDGIEVLYTFDQGVGATVFDVSGESSALDLTIENPANASRTLDGGLLIGPATRVSNSTDGNKIYTSCTAANELTVEAWIVPDNTTFGGPARIVTQSLDGGNRNFTLAQGSGVYEARLRTTTNGKNGTFVTLIGASASTELQHVVFTRDAAGNATLYINGAVADGATIGGNLSNWNAAYDFGLANEFGFASTSTNRDWLGEYRLVAVYCRALSTDEVLQNYEAGPDGPECVSDADCDGLPNGVDPCPDDARNLCFGPAAMDAFTSTEIRINANVSGEACSGPKDDCTGKTWDTDFGWNQSLEWSICDLGGGGEGCVISGIEAIFGCEDEQTEDIFQCDHWDSVANPELFYEFDVDPGTYLVNLLFANTDSSTVTVGSRVFDIWIQGNLVYDDFDQIAAAGGSGIAVVRSAVATVEEGELLRIEFGHVAGGGDPAVKGIEVLAEACVADADCDDGNDCTADVCNTVTFTCEITPEADGTLCEDSAFCTDGDVCSSGSCSPGTGDPCLAGAVCNEVTDTCDAPDLCTGMDCNDGNVCTDDSCDSATGTCVNTNNTASCDDGDACTTADTCSAGSCVGGAPPTCDDGNVCTDDSCNSGTGCVNLENTGPCDDSNACTQTDICSAGACTGGSPLTCAEGLVCDPATGNCEPEPGRVIDGIEVLYTFDQGVGATVFDVSGEGSALDLTTENPANASRTLDGGLLIGPATRVSNSTDGNKIYTSCTAANELTVEAWIVPDNTSFGGPARIVTQSLDGGNRNFTLAQGPGNYEARLRTTKNGTNGTNVQLIGTSATTTLQHVVFTRDAAGNATLYIDGAVADSDIIGGDLSNWNAAYDFGLANEFSAASTSTNRDWLGEYRLVAVYCRALSALEVLQNYQAGTDVPECFDNLDCDDGNDCTADVCNTVTFTCEITPEADGTLCDDGAFCTDGDVCSSGSCSPGTGDPCGAVDTCNEGTDMCDPPDLCTGKDCNDGDVCTDDSCDLATGACVNTNNTASCDDGDACTTADTCSAGSCVGGAPPTCDDGNVCTDDSCNSGTGCVNLENTGPCDDGNACTQTDLCGAGACTGGSPLTCNEGLVCDPDTGSCEPEPGRVIDGLEVLYTFDQGDDPVVDDVSGVGSALDLTIENPANASRTLDGGLLIGPATRVSNSTDGNKIYTSCTAANELTVEAWIVPDNTSFGGPARIVTQSLDGGNRDFTLAQGPGNYEARLRTTTNGNNGTFVTLIGASASTELQHVVFTRDAAGNATLYIDGAVADSDIIGGDLSNWNAAYDFGLANEFTSASTSTNRDWLGEYRLVAVYCRALSTEEVGQNYNAGTDGPTCDDDLDCDDGFYCTGVETCDPGTGICQSGTPRDCDDSVDCTDDSCDEDADSCENLPDDNYCDSGLACVNDFCDPFLGCVADPVGAGTPCDSDADLCTLDECDAGGLCANVGDVTCLPGATCDPGTGSCEGAPDQPTNVEPTDEATGVSTSPTLTVNVTDPNADSLDVTFFGRGAGTGESFTIVVLPDTQNYADHNQANQAIFGAQTQWIVDNKDALNIAFVTQVGDCVQYGSAYPSEWVTADAAFSLLEDPATTMLPAGLPYGIAVGNHDQSPIGSARGVDEGATTTEYNATFGVSRFQGRGYYGGHYDFGNPALYTNNNDNHYQFFSAGGMDFIVIHLEYDLVDGPTRAAVLAWADNLLTTHSDKRAIVVSHYITGIHPGYIAPAPDLQSFGPQGQATYDALKDNPNLFLTLSGHVAGVGRRVDTFNGNAVHSVLQNYQLEPNGGNGWLRIFEFVPADDEIRVSTYSPWLDQPWVVNGAESWRDLSENEFTLPYEMSGFEIIGSVSGIPSGGNASLTWPALNTASEHEWFVEVSDGASTTTGPVWTFTTGCTLNAECDDGNACTDDTCNLATGACEYADNNDPCDDADVCTETDVCSGGVCGGAPIAGCCVSNADCDDLDSCSVDECVGNTCGYAAVPNCCELDIDCDDGDPCTIDSCGGSAALSFDGVDDYVDFGNDPWISDFGTASLTVEGWFKANSVDENFKGLFHVGRRGDNSQLAVYLLTGAQLAAAVEDTALGKVDAPGVGFTLGEWNHFAAVVDRTTNQLRVYLNGGSPVIGTLPAGFGSIDGGSDNTVLGALRLSSGVLDTFFDGGMDEIRIWDHARTQTEIQDNMNLQIGAAPGLIERWGLNEGSGGTTSASVSTPTNDGTINGAIWIGSNLVDLGNQCTFTPIPGCGGFECTVAADCDDTDACTLDECSDNTCSNTAIPDCCTVDADCNDVDACTTDACGNPVALSFDGVDDSVEFSNDASISDFGTSDRTVEGWFKPDTVGTGFPGIFHLGRKGANPQVAVFLFNGDLAVGVEDNAAHSVDLVDPTELTAGQWYHFAAVIDRTNDQLRLYLDGDAPLTGNISSLTGDIEGVGDAVGIGALRSSAGVFDTFFVGSIDEIRIWDHARSQTQIQDNMNLQIDAAAGLIERWGLNEGSGGTTSASVSSPTNDGTLNGATWIGSDLVDLGNQCTFTPIPGCGFECTVAADCADTSACTLDECSDNTCSNTAIPGCCISAAECDDTNACTLDECSDNTCSNTAIPDCCTVDADCNDVDACTTDACGNPVALSFDGVDDSVEFSNDASISDFGTSDRTVEGWFKPGTVGAGFPGIFHLGRKGANPQVAVFLFNGDLAVGVEDNAAHSVDLVDPTELTAGQWYHFAAVIDRTNDQLRLYLDGGAPLTGNISSLTGDIEGVGDAVGIGALRSSAGVFDTFFVGSIDEIRIWDHARSQTQIQDNMNLQIDAAAGLIERWGLNEGSGGTTSASVSSPTNDGTLNGATWIASDLVDLGNQCTFTAIPDCCEIDADCENGLFCDGDEVCNGGVCESLGDPCLAGGECADTCDELNDTCDLPAGTTCGDGTDDQCLNPDSCDGAGVCLANDEADGATCDDGNPLTIDDQCTGGVCGGTAVECTVATDCDDSNECTLDECLGDDTCSNSPLAGGTACGDGTDDQCLNPDSCDGAGVCLANDEPDATTCDDGEPLTIEDQCTGGVCGGTAVECVVDGDCDDGDACTTNACGNPAALSFDGVDDLVALSADTSISDFGTSDRTVEGWFKPSTLGAGFPGIFHLGRKGTNPQVAVFLFNGELAVGVEDNAANKLDLIETTTLAAGQWYHFAAVIDRTNDELLLYLDGGAPLTGDISSVSGPIAGVGDAVALGALRNSSGVPDTFLAGAIDEVRIWDHARTQTQIQDNMNLQIESAPGLIERWGLNEGSGGTTSASVSSPTNDGTLNGATWIASDLVDLGNQCTFTAIPDCCEIDADCENGLFCDGDEVCNGGVCESLGDPCLAGGECADTCDELNDTCDLPAGTTCGDGTDDQCLNPDSCDGAGVCLANDEADGATCDDGNPLTIDDQCTGGVCGGTAVECTVATDCDDSNECTLDECLGDDTCSNSPLAGGTACGDGTDDQCLNPDSCDGAGVCLANDEPDATTCDDGEPLTIEDQCTGGVCGGTAVECVVDGDCDDGDACTTNACGNPAALSFDGVDDLVALSADTSISDFGTSDRTVEGWFKPSTLGAGFPGIFHLGRKGTNPQVAVFLFNGELAVGVEDNAANKLDLIETTTLAAGQWYHFAAVIDRTNDELLLYLDGGAPLTGDISSVSGPIAGVGDAVALGALRNSSGVPDTFLAGAIDEVRIWDHARTQTQIQDNMNLQIESAPGLIERWGLNEGSGGTTSASVSSPTNDGTLNGATWIASDLVDLGNQCTFTPVC